MHTAYDIEFRRTAIAINYEKPICSCLVGLHFQVMPSCCDSPKEPPSYSDPPSGALFPRLYSLSPIALSLLHSSCCWLPVSTCTHIYAQAIDLFLRSFQVLLDISSVGSASATALHRLRPLFLLTTLLLLIASVRREGLCRRSLLRIAVSGLVLGLPQLSTFARRSWTPTAAHKSCH
jgi:hypothetical protein